MSETRVPFTVLTGFLGAGKTTTLNRVLRAPHDRKVAVLVNELGRIAIDTELIVSRGDDVLELAGGCLCCKIDVKNDLWDGIIDIIQRSRPDHVVLETTGIAEPEAIFDGLARLIEDGAPAAGLIEAAGVVCAIDAADGVKTLDRREEARLQVRCADRLLLTKLDVASAEEAAAVRERLHELNPTAERASFPDGPDGDRLLSLWLLESRPRGSRGGSPRPHHHHHHRDGQVVAVCLEESGWFLRDAVLELIEGESDHLLRVKGFIALSGEPRRAELQLSGSRVDLRLGDPWPGGEPRTQLVFIGEGLDEAALRRRLWACRVEQAGSG